jgi:hypothetical protein
MPDQAVLDTIELYTDAMRRGDYDTMTQLMHPEDLARFKELIVTVGELAEADGEFAGFGALLDGIDSLQQLKETDPEFVFAKFMTAITRLIPELGGALEGAQITVIGYVFEDVEVEADAAEGAAENADGADAAEDAADAPPAMIHVVHRTEIQMQGVTIRTIDTITMGWTGDRYLILIDEQIEGVIQGIKGQFQ